MKFGLGKKGSAMSSTWQNHLLLKKSFSARIVLQHKSGAGFSSMAGAKRQLRGKKPEFRTERGKLKVSCLVAMIIIYHREYRPDPLFESDFL